MSASRRLVLLFAIPVAVFAAIQLAPFGHDHSAPPDGTRPAWDSPRTQQLAERACLDCHGNQTRWPWYSNIAPVSWRIQDHVQAGRAKLNFSAFDPAVEEVAEAAGEAGETVTKKEMPPFDYLLAHPEARLTVDERRALAQGLDVMFASFKERAPAPAGSGTRSGGGRERREHDEDEEHEEHERGGR